MYKIMTPGPTQVAENVRMARMKECTNPDLDTSFCEFYKETSEVKTIDELLAVCRNGVSVLQMWYSLSENDIWVY